MCLALILTRKRVDERKEANAGLNNSKKIRQTTGNLPTYKSINHLLSIVPPLIRIRNQVVGVAAGSSPVLECEVEAYPEPVR